MDIRRLLSKNGTSAVIVAAALIVIGVLLIWRQLSHSGANLPSITAKDFYSDDDGKTWFEDDAGNVPPFDHNGKLAYRVEVYRCDDGKPFVSYLAGYDEDDRQKIASAPLERRGYVRVELHEMVKRPGVAAWIKLTPNTAKEYEKAQRTVCPDGSTRKLVQVMPSSQ